MLSKPLTLKYRPQRFKDLVGNDLSIKILKNSVVSGNIKNAYFFEGGKGSGKCLKIGSRVYDPTIGNYINLGEEYLGGVVGKEDFKLVPASFKEVVFLGEKPCLKIKTNFGSELEPAVTHKFLTWHGFKEAHELRVGDYVATARRLPVSNLEESSLSVAQASLIGYMLGDGSCKAKVKFWLNRSEIGIRDHFISLLQEIGVPKSLIRVEETHSVNCDTIFVDCRDYEILPESWRRFGSRNQKLHPLKTLLKDSGIYGCTPHTKFIPREVFNLRDQELREFLACLWVTDGHFSIKSGGRGPSFDVAYTTVSKRLALDLKTILLRFGVRTIIRKRNMLLSGTEKRFPAFEVSAAFAEDAIWLCNLPIRQKRESADKVLKLLVNSNKTHDDLFPVDIWHKLKSLYLSFEEKPFLRDSKGRAKLTSKSRPSRSTVRRFAELFNSKELLEVADGDIMWERITCIEDIGVHECVDISDSSAENTFIAGSFVTHNTTTVRIFSRAVNCLSPENGEPCNKCHSCTASFKEQNPDILEIDAASENTVERIRSIIQGIHFMPSMSSKKIVILDECLEENTPIIVFNGALVPIKEVRVGDYVLVGKEQKKVTGVFTAERECKRIVTSVGEVEASTNHQFYSREGKVKVTDLSVGDELELSKPPQYRDFAGVEFSLAETLGVCHAVGKMTRAAKAFYFQLGGAYNLEALDYIVAAVKRMDINASFSELRHSLSVKPKGLSIKSTIFIDWLLDNGFERGIRKPTKLPSWVLESGTNAINYLSGFFRFRELVPVRRAKKNFPKAAFKLEFESKNFCNQFQFMISRLLGTIVGSYVNRRSEDTVAEIFFSKNSSLMLVKCIRERHQQRTSVKSRFVKILEILDVGTKNVVDLQVEDVHEFQTSVFRSSNCHMLSTAAGNTLLKTLEEPPDHAIFMLCTTDPQKVLDTVLSRCLRFQFQRLSKNSIADRLLFIAEKENLVLDKEAADIIASSTHGAMRDAITILDQASQLGEEISAQIVSDIIGFIPTEACTEFLFFLGKKDLDNVFKWINMQLDHSRSEADILSALGKTVYTTIMVQQGASPRHLSESAAASVKSAASEIQLQHLLDMLRTIKAAQADIRKGGDAQTALALAAGAMLSRDKVSSFDGMSLLELSRSKDSGKTKGINLIRRYFEGSLFLLDEDS